MFSRLSKWISFYERPPDDKYLVMKVALIAGVAGACRGKELVDLKVNDAMWHYDKLRPLIQNFLFNTLTENELSVQWGKICLVYFHGKYQLLKLEKRQLIQDIVSDVHLRLY
ncbi:hypothetical protein NQ317_004557 [Molorchus minor]|uniref:Uncharacterized protein n=1 Tax=Molorchus minor TaxID=1323400 RepID=A0ABQ9J3C5_9CUCU|nr:hypothetical protein NQ317_004557 [Molorchus minor]